MSAIKGCQPFHQCSRYSPGIMTSYRHPPIRFPFLPPPRPQDASKALGLAQQTLAAITDTLSSISGTAVAGLRATAVVPQATFHVIKAALHLLGKEPETFKNWKRAFEYFTPATFEELVAYDATQVREGAGRALR